VDSLKVDIFERMITPEIVLELLTAFREMEADYQISEQLRKEATRKCVKAMKEAEAMRRQNVKLKKLPQRTEQRTRAAEASLQEAVRALDPFAEASEHLHPLIIDGYGLTLDGIRVSAWREAWRVHAKHRSPS
jgi:hypothetical protein